MSTSLLAKEVIATKPAFFRQIIACLVYQPHAENWNDIRKAEIVNELRSALRNGGKLFGAYDSKKLIGFACIDGVLLGSEKQYLELTWFHVSYEYRGNKIGKKLFCMCIEAAKQYGCKKLYIVASSFEESQKAYHKLGCVYANEYIKGSGEDIITVNVSLDENGYGNISDYYEGLKSMEDNTSGTYYYSAILEEVTGYVIE